MTGGLSYGNLTLLTLAWEISKSLKWKINYE